VTTQNDSIKIRPPALWCRGAFDISGKQIGVGVQKIVQLGGIGFGRGEHGLHMTGIFQKQAVLGAGVEGKQLLSHGKGDHLVCRGVDEKGGQTGAAHSLSYIGLGQIISGDQTVQVAQGMVKRSHFRPEHPGGIGKGTVGDNALYVVRTASAHAKHRGAAHGEAVQKELRVPAEGVQKELQPVQAVGPLEHAVAHQPASALAGGGVVTAEHIKASVVIIAVKQPAGLPVLRMQPVDQKGDLSRRPFAAGVIEAFQENAPGRGDGKFPVRQSAHMQGRGPAALVKVPTSGMAAQNAGQGRTAKAELIGSRREEGGREGEGGKGGGAFHEILPPGSRVRGRGGVRVGCAADRAARSSRHGRPLRSFPHSDPCG